MDFVGQAERGRVLPAPAALPGQAPHCEGTAGSGDSGDSGDTPGQGMLTLTQTGLDPRVPHVCLLPVEPQPVLCEIPAGGRRRGGLELWGKREGDQHPCTAGGG